jgi:hypothetical protein
MTKPLISDLAPTIVFKIYVLDSIKTRTSSWPAVDCENAAEYPTRNYFMYERVIPPLWAAGLRVIGIDKAYDESATFLLEYGSGIVADVSCGNGCTARQLASGGPFRHVVALDCSQEMLDELVSELKRIPLLDKHKWLWFVNYSCRS